MNTLGILEAKSIIKKFIHIYSSQKQNTRSLQQTRCSTVKDERPKEVPESEKQDQNSSKRCSASQDITEMLTLKGCHEFVPRTHIVHTNPVIDIDEAVNITSEPHDTHALKTALAQ